MDLGEIEGVLICGDYYQKLMNEDDPREGGNEHQPEVEDEFTVYREPFIKCRYRNGY